MGDSVILSLSYKELLGLGLPWGGSFPIEKIPENFRKTLDKAGRMCYNNLAFGENRVFISCLDRHSTLAKVAELV